MEYFLALLQPRLHGISAGVISLPGHLAKMPSRDDLTPIMPLQTQYARQLSAHLLSRGMNARAITWSTVPKGKDRVRVCIHAGNAAEEIKNLTHGVLEWALDKNNARLNVMLASKL